MSRRHSQLGEMMVYYLGWLACELGMVGNEPATCYCGAVHSSESSRCWQCGKEIAGK